VVCYSPECRASAETGLVKWGAISLDPNRDHREADDCMQANAVPGVLL